MTNADGCIQIAGDMVDSALSGRDLIVTQSFFSAAQIYLFTMEYSHSRQGVEMNPSDISGLGANLVYSLDRMLSVFNKDTGHRYSSSTLTSRVTPTELQVGWYLVVPTKLNVSIWVLPYFPKHILL